MYIILAIPVECSSVGHRSASADVRHTVFKIFKLYYSSVSAGNMIIKVAVFDDHVFIRCHPSRGLWELFLFCTPQASVGRPIRISSNQLQPTENWRIMTVRAGGDSLRVFTVAFVVSRLNSPDPTVVLHPIISCINQCSGVHRNILYVQVYVYIGNRYLF